MRSYRKYVTSIKTNQSYEAKPIEIVLEEITTTNEPISADAPIIYTSRADGVMAGYDIRTDRFDVAIEAMSKVAKSKVATREAYMELQKGGKKPETGVNTSDTTEKAV